MEHDISRKKDFILYIIKQNNRIQNVNKSPFTVDVSITDEGLHVNQELLTLLKAIHPQ